MNRRCVLVAGLPRTGTTVMMRILEASGLSPVIEHPITYETSIVLQDKLRDFEFPYLSGRAIKVLNLQPGVPAGDYVTIVMQREARAAVESQARVWPKMGMKRLTASQQRQLIRTHDEAMQQIVDHWSTVGEVQHCSFEDLIIDPVDYLVGLSRRVPEVCFDAADQVFKNPYPPAETEETV